jgi:hypothetical protein
VLDVLDVAGANFWVVSEVLIVCDGAKFWVVSEVLIVCAGADFWVVVDVLGVAGANSWVVSDVLIVCDGADFWAAPDVLMVCTGDDIWVSLACLRAGTSCCACPPCLPGPWSNMDKRGMCFVFFCSWNCLDVWYPPVACWSLVLLMLCRPHPGVPVYPRLDAYSLPTIVWVTL